jgi:hypothetical protein
VSRQEKEQKLFRVWFEDDKETMWASRVGPGLYCLDNVPFLTELVSNRDIVRAETDDAANPQFVRFVEVAERGGHSTFWVRVNEGDDNVRDSEFIFDFMKENGCLIERARDRLVAIDVPPIEAAAMDRVWLILGHSEDDGLWQYGAGYTVAGPPWLGTEPRE